MLAASLNFLYSNSRCDQFLRGSSQLVLALRLRAAAPCRDLISTSVLAMSRKSPTAFTSSCSSTSRYSRNWSVIGAIGMSTISTSCLRTRYKQQVERTAEDFQIDAKTHRRTTCRPKTGKTERSAHDPAVRAG